MHLYQSTKFQFGFTLIELMIGLTLAMLLTLAVGNIYVQTRQTFRTQSAITRQADEGKYALSSIQRIAYQAGFRDEANMKFKNADFIANYGIDAANIIKGDGASINARFFGDPDGNIISCAADTTGNSDYPQLKDSIQHAYKIYLDDTQLKCGKLSTAGAISDSQVIANNVVDFKITYGTDSNADFVADTYKNTGVIWNYVYSIKTCLVTKSNENNIAVKTNNRSYINCDNTSTSINSDDGAIYRIFSTTVSLRNKTIE